MSADRKSRWRKEIEWLLSVTDHIVEFAPSQQIAKDGSSMEVCNLIMSLPSYPSKFKTNILLTIKQYVMILCRS